MRIPPSRNSLCQIRRLYAGALLACLLALPLAVGGQAPAPAAPRPIAIVGATVVNLDGGAAIPDAVVVVEQGRIVAVGPRASTTVPPGAETVRADGKWLVPGLMNMHVHLGLILPGRAGAELANESESALGLRMAFNARQSLLSGVTTVRLTGDPAHADFALRRAIERGEAEGPRIYTAGQAIRVTGGHGTLGVNGVGNDGPAEFRKATRLEIFAGAEWIKIAISGGIADLHGDVAAGHMTRDEIEAVTDIAHRHGVKVTAHSGSADATDEAIDAGIDCVEHGYFLTDAVLQKMKTKGIWLVPTIVVTQAGARQFYQKIGSPDWYLKRVESVGKQHWETLQHAIAMGIPIALGTDQFPFEPNDGTTATIREAQHYVEAGMTSLQALRAATIEAATLLGIADQVGSIDKGKLADLVLTDGDPSRDIKALRTIRFVMKDGKIARNDLASAPPAPSSSARQ